MFAAIVCQTSIPNLENKVELTIEVIVSMENYRVLLRYRGKERAGMTGILMPHLLIHFVSICNKGGKPAVDGSRDVIFRATKPRHKISKRAPMRMYVPMKHTKSLGLW